MNYISKSLAKIAFWKNILCFNFLYIKLFPQIISFSRKIRVTRERKKWMKKKRKTINQLQADRGTTVFGLDSHRKGYYERTRQDKSSRQTKSFCSYCQRSDVFNWSQRNSFYWNFFSTSFTTFHICSLLIENKTINFYS